MIFRQMRKSISNKQLPISVLDVDKVARVLADFDKRINQLERHEGFSSAFKDTNRLNDKKRERPKKNRKNKRKN